jgi:hypothetical protein
MLSHYAGILNIFGAFLPAIFAGHVFFNPARAYALWAKAASSIAALAGIAWGVLGYAVDHDWYSSKYAYFELLALKHQCAGLVLGFVLSISMARPYKKISSDDVKPDASRKV